MKVQMFFLMLLIFVLAAICITYKVMVAYTTFTWPFRIIIFAILCGAWFSPMLLRLIRKMPPFFNGAFYDICYKTGYFFMGLALILFMLLLVRDILWHILHFIINNPSLHPNNAHTINTLNVITLGIAFLISFYGLYEAHKKPVVYTFDIADPRIKKPVNIVVASDLHINQSTPWWHIKKMVKQINAQSPDYVLLVGDIADDEPEYTLEKINFLSTIQAKKIYLTLGNHEYYHRPYAWIEAFSDLGLEVLHNDGQKIEDTGIYVGGVPDVGSVNVSYEKAFAGASTDHYKILMSHSPADFKRLDQTLFDIQVSGHTHGGQIFPFQYLTKKANGGYLKGLYQETAKLFISKGAGYWGPPMRIGAEPDIAVFKFMPPAQN